MKGFITLEVAKLLWEKRAWYPLDHVYVLNGFKYIPPQSDETVYANPGDFIMNYDYCVTPIDLDLVNDVVSAPKISEVTDMFRETQDINIYAKSTGNGYTYVIQHRGVNVKDDPFHIFKDYDVCMNEAIKYVVNKYL